MQGARVAGLLLTGGSSSRMGTTKATLRLPGESETFAERSGRLLADAVAPGPAFEVGPGHSGLPSCAERGFADPGTGPLTAVVAGWRALAAHGHSGPVLVLATDLPSVSAEALAFVASFPGRGSVVPVVGGHRQPLAARWSVADLARAAELAARGERSLRRVFGPDASFLDEVVWGGVVPASVFVDVDTPDDLEALATGQGSILTSRRSAPRSRGGPAA